MKWKKGVMWCLYLIFGLVWLSVVWKNPYNVSCSESVINDFVPSYLWALDCPHQALLPKKKENVQASSLSLQKKLRKKQILPSNFSMNYNHRTCFIVSKVNCVYFFHYLISFWGKSENGIFGKFCVILEQMLQTMP